MADKNERQDEYSCNASIGMAFVQAIESRISHFTYTPVPNGELLQILRYEKDQYYKPHHDYFSDEVRPSASDPQ
jgi:hypothetical protein